VDIHRIAIADPTRWIIAYPVIRISNTPEDRIPPPKFRKQIPPRRAGAGNPKNRFEKAAVILAAAPRIAGLARKQRRNPLPLRIAQNSSNQGSSPYFEP